MADVSSRGGRVMRRVIVSVAVVLCSLTATAATTHGAAAPAPATAQFVPTGACKRWWPVAHDVGWRADEWYTLNRIMYAESRCNPDAWNPNPWWGGHASGLMQIIWPTWRAECGAGNIFRPRFNLRCAKYIKRHYGWSMWATY